MIKNYTLAVFDFDGTITKSDSFLHFIFFAAPLYKILGSFLLIPVILTYFFGFMSNNKAKEKIFSYFFKDMRNSDFIRKSEEFTLREINSLIREKALNKINWHRAQGHSLVIISASMINWIEPWANKHGFEDVIATVPEIKDGRITGNFATPNCSGLEKKRRFLEKYPEREKYFLYVYSDSKKDKPLLSLADYKFFKRF